MNDLGDELTSGDQKDDTSSGVVCESGCEPLLFTLLPSGGDSSDGSRRPASPLLLPGTTPTTSCQRPAGGSSLASSHGDRSKKCSVHIVEPLPTFAGGGRGSRASFGNGFTVNQPEEKHGVLQRAIPVMPFGLAVVACVLNIVIPGVGTLIAAFSVFCCGSTTRLEGKFKAFLLNIVAGLLQLTTFLVIIGWIWSISWGMTFVQLARSAKENNQRAPIPYYVRRHSSVE